MNDPTNKKAGWKLTHPSGCDIKFTYLSDASLGPIHDQLNTTTRGIHSL